MGGPAGHYGVLVNGSVLSPIEVDYTVRGADLIAASFPQPISIGVHLQGSVIAIDPAGLIHDLVVGRGTDFDAPNTTAYAGIYHRGMVAVNVPPKDDAIRFGDPELWFLENANACGGARDYTLGSVDSTIRAPRIDTVSIRTMSQSEGKKEGPRIESPSIGTCIVDYLIHGLIWSGDVEFDQDCLDDGCPQSAGDQGCVLDLAADDFATISSLSLQCVGQHGRVWFRDCLFASIKTSLYGELHVDQLRTEETIWIGDELGLVPNGPTCVPPASDGIRDERAEPYLNTLERSPRAMRRNSSVPHPDRGRIFVHNEQGLHGQVIINGDYIQAVPTPDSWKGQVIVGYEQIGAFFPDGFLSDIVLGPTDDDNLPIPQPNIGPYYDRTSAELGGGAVGLAPYHLHQKDSSPVHKDNTIVGPGDGTFEADIPDDFIYARFYGPLAKGTSYFTWQQAFDVQCRPLGLTGNDRCNWFTVTSSFRFTGPTAASVGQFSRSIKVNLAPGIHPGPGIYRLIPRVNVETEVINSVLSRTVSGTPAVVLPLACGGLTADDPIMEYQSYIFRIKPNCDGVTGNTEDDETQNPPPTCTGSCAVADFNNSGEKSVQDIFDFLTAYFGNCIDPNGHNPPCNPPLPPLPPECIGDADINGNCMISVQDVFDFLSAYFGCADE